MILANTAFYLQTLITFHRKILCISQISFFGLWLLIAIGMYTGFVLLQNSIDEFELLPF
jgi:hypothetical protein